MGSSACSLALGLASLDNHTNQLLVINLSCRSAFLENPNLHPDEESFLKRLSAVPARAACLPLFSNRSCKDCVSNREPGPHHSAEGPALFLTPKDEGHSQAPASEKQHGAPRDSTLRRPHSSKAITRLATSAEIPTWPRSDPNLKRPTARFPRSI